MIGAFRRYYVGVVHRCAPALSTTTYSHSMLRTRSIGCPFQNLSDAHTRLPRMPVRAFVRCPYSYPCVWALGGNFIMACAVHTYVGMWRACQGYMCTVPSSVLEVGVA